VLSILDRASKRAAEELRNEPEVAARLLQTTGEIYINLGLPQESERDLRKALALSPAMGETRARILLGLATGAYGRSDAKAALALVDSAEAAVEPRADYAPAVQAEATFWRAMTQFLDGDYAKSVVELDKALSRFAALPGDHRKEMGRVWMRKGVALTNMRNFVESDAAFAKAEALYTAKFGKNHLLTAVALQNRALGALGNNQLDLAETKITEALAIYDRILDPDHPTVGTSMLLLGRIRTARADYEGAIAAFDKSRSIYAKLYGRDTTNIGDVNFYASEAETGLGDTEAALELLRETKRIYDKAYGPDDPDQVELLLARMKVYAGAKRFPEATIECRAAVALALKLDASDTAIPDMQVQCDQLSNSIYAAIAKK
jgi:tetratricopeptide (TPR) repeat protein